MPSVPGVVETRFTARTALGRRWQLRRPERVGSFLDWAVDSVPLLDRLAEPLRRASITSSWMTTLTSDHPDALDQIDQLLGDPGSIFDDGRVALYVCPKCSDPWSGTVSTDVVFTADVVHWRAIGWQRPQRPAEPFEPSVDLSFGRGQYEDALRDVRRAFARHRST